MDTYGDYIWSAVGGKSGKSSKKQKKGIMTRTLGMKRKKIMETKKDINKKN